MLKLAAWFTGPAPMPGAQLLRKARFKYLCARIMAVFNGRPCPSPAAIAADRVQPVP